LGTITHIESVRDDKKYPNQIGWGSVNILNKRNNTLELLSFPNRFFLRGCFLLKKCKQGGDKMQFSNISELELANIFVHAKKEKIEKLLGVKNLNTHIATEMVYRFLRKQSPDFWNDYQNKYTALFDEVFFYMIVDELQTRQNCGKKLDGNFRFVEPNIAYVS